LFRLNVPAIMTETSMILRLVAAALFVFGTTSTAPAQRGQRPSFPAEKFSPRPVQPKANSKPALLPTASEKEQKQRWDERSRHPFTGPR
jgi:hypothetical protein